MKKTDIAYIAGLFDGEGSIQITNYIHKGNGSQCWEVRCSLAQKESYLPLLMQFHFGGSVQRRYKGHNTRHWKASGRDTYEFLKVVLPYLKVKRPQAELGIKFQERIWEQKQKWGRSGLPDEELAVRQAQRILMSKMKHYGKDVLASY